MAWWGFWRRRRRWPKRRWRWRRRRRRPRPRRRRRAARASRRPRVRRRRWRGGWRRRTYIRRTRRKRRRKKFKLTQWNPSTVKRCTIRGYIPLIICGTGTTGTSYLNYASHMFDNKKLDPYGGGVSTMMFTLQGLFEEYQRHRNKWSTSNVDLELVRYHGCSMKLYRSPTADFIFQYNRKAPFNDTQLTCPAMQPCVQLNTKGKKIILKSFATKPKGRGSVTVKIAPPTLFQDRWYFQKDLRNVPLVTTKAIAANLRFPFCPPQTDNCCIYFQVLHPFFNNILSITPQYLPNNYLALKNHLSTHFTTRTNPQKGGTTGVYFNTFKTEEHIFEPNWTQYKETATNFNTPQNKKYSNISSLWGDNVYQQGIVQAFEQNATNMYNARKRTTFQESKYLSHKTGIFSPILLSQQRLSPDYPGMYWTVTYNPFNDKGIGNKVWIDWCTKNDSQYRETAGRIPIVDIPLYAALLGYRDYCSKYYHDRGLHKEVRVTIQCPYTDPPLYDKDNTDMGYVPYDFNFGDGKMPDGAGYIPEEYRFKWYICMFHQQGWMNDIVQCGPFAYNLKEKNVALVCKYKFNFSFGGNPIVTQTLKDPSTQPDYPIPGSGQFPTRLQVTDPKLLNEGYIFRRWDIRRGFYGEKSIKRMQQKPTNADLLTGPSKKPRFEVPAAAQEEDSTSGETKLVPWYESSVTETETEAEVQEETQETHLHEQLKQQLLQQRKLQRHLRFFFEQLVKTQHHLHVPLYPQ
nr:MAG: ORF1 [Torque teno virus]